MLGVVDCEAVTTDPTEGVACELLHPVERALGERHQPMRLLEPEVCARPIVRRGRASEREAAVPPACAGGDLAGLVEPHPDSARCKR